MKKLLLYLGIGILAIALPVGVLYFGKTQSDIRTRAAPATTLSLTPSSQTVTVGSPVKLNVDINPGTNQVVSADISLVYDPEKLEAVTITNGTNAPRVLTSGIIENGTASIKVGAASNTQPITAPGTIAVISFTAKGVTDSTTPAAVTFASNTFIGGINEETANVLTTTTPAEITINATESAEVTSATKSANLAVSFNLSPSPTATSASVSNNLSPLSATGSAHATSSALVILSPAENTNVTDQQPVIRGKAAPGSTVTIVIHSDTELTVTVTADSDGNWVYTPTTPLEPGPHTVVASGLTTDGTTQTSTSSFIVAGAGETATPETVTPVAGNEHWTILLIGISIILLLSGVFVWHF